MNKFLREARMTEVVIKPHHFFDIIKLYGAGITCFIRDEAYHHDFYRIANQILAEPRLRLRLTIHGDDICIPCKYYSAQGKGVCMDGISHIAGIDSKDEWNKILDHRMISMIMPEEETVYTAVEFCQLLYENRDLIYDIWREDDGEKTKERFRLFRVGAEKYLRI